MEEDPRQYYINRVRAIQEQKASGNNPFPHKFTGPNRISLSDYISRYHSDEVVAPGERLEDQIVSVTGRIYSIRGAGKKLIFYDLRAEGSRIQVMADQRASKQSGTDTPAGFRAHHSTIKRGDIVGITGIPGKSQRGELSIVPHEMQVLTPCLHTLPTLHFGVQDQELGIGNATLT